MIFFPTCIIRCLCYCFLPLLSNFFTIFIFLTACLPSANWVFQSSSIYFWNNSDRYFLKQRGTVFLFFLLTFSISLSWKWYMPGWNFSGRTWRISLLVTTTQSSDTFGEEENYIPYSNSFFFSGLINTFSFTLIVNQRILDCLDCFLYS